MNLIYDLTPFTPSEALHASTRIYRRYTHLQALHASTSATRLYTPLQSPGLRPTRVF